MQDVTVGTRGYLPHWDAPGATQFLTWRLADSLPTDVFARLRDEHRAPPAKAALWKKVEGVLDSGLGSCLLSNPVAAEAVSSHLLQLDGDVLALHAFVVMPNHVHTLLTISPGIHLADLVQQLKGSTSRAINLALGRTGRLWQPDYFDRLIRDDDHFRRTAEYIHWNPVKAGLVVDPKWYPHSSANPRFALDSRWRSADGWTNPKHTSPD